MRLYFRSYRLLAAGVCGALLIGAMLLFALPTLAQIDKPDSELSALPDDIAVFGSISGLVTDTDGNGLPNVSIFVDDADSTLHI